MKSQNKKYKIKFDSRPESNYTIPLDRISLILPSRNESPALISLRLRKLRCLKDEWLRGQEHTLQMFGNAVLDLILDLVVIVDFVIKNNINLAENIKPDTSIQSTLPGSCQ